MLTQARVRELLDYDSETGVFRWRVTRGGQAKTGTVAGGLNEKGYRKIRIDGRKYHAGKLAWLYVHGVWLRSGPDHKNCQRDDDRLNNLREATHQQNCQNRRRRSDNTSGFKGVSRSRRGWVATICIEGGNRRVGVFDTPEAAHGAYTEAARKHFGEFARPA